MHITYYSSPVFVHCKWGLEHTSARKQIKREVWRRFACKLSVLTRKEEEQRQVWGMERGVLDTRRYALVVRSPCTRGATSRRHRTSTVSVSAVPRCVMLRCALRCRSVSVMLMRYTALHTRIHSVTQQALCVCLRGNWFRLLENGTDTICSLFMYTPVATGIIHKSGMNV